MYKIIKKNFNYVSIIYLSKYTTLVCYLTIKQNKYYIPIKKKLKIKNKKRYLEKLNHKINKIKLVNGLNFVP